MIFAHHYPSYSVLLLFHKQPAAAPPTYPLHSQLLLFTAAASASSLRLPGGTDFTQSSRKNSHKSLFLHFLRAPSSVQETKHLTQTDRQTDTYSGMNNKRSRTKKISQCTYKSSKKEKSQKLSGCFSLLLPWLSTLHRHDENSVGRESAKCSQISHHRDQNKHKQGPTDRRQYRSEHRQKRESFRESERACTLRCESAANDERLCFAREGKGGRGRQEGEGDIYSQKDIFEL